jgi:hypothetical protein
MTQVVPSSRVTHDAVRNHRAMSSNGGAIGSNWVLSSTGSNFGVTWTPRDTGAAVIYGTTATDVTTASSGGAAGSASRSDHAHKGVHSVSVASNTLFGDITLSAEGQVGITINGQTIAINVAGSGGGGGGGTGSSALLQAIYGNGSDGDVTIAAGTTTLTRDMYYNNLTVTGTLATNGWRVFCKTSVSGAGTISNNPTAATAGGNGTGAAGGSAGGAGGVTSANQLGSGSQGVVGRIGGFNAVGLQGTQGQLSTQARNDGTTVDQPASTAGGNGTSAGGAGRGATTGDNTLDPKVATYPICIAFRDFLGSAIPLNSISGRAHSGGSGGGGSGAGGGGSGGSGAGGGPIVLVAKTWSGSFTVQSKGSAGGNGGNGFAGGAGAAGGGAGSNGGPGGIVTAIYVDRSGWSGSIDVSGGAGGTHGNGGNGGTNGGDGATGPTGHKLEFQMG